MSRKQKNFKFSLDITNLFRRFVNMKRMKHLILIAFAIVSVVQSAMSQQVWGKVDEADYAYVDFSFDGNTLFLIKDNPRMERDVRGLDWDLEIGARDRRFAVYLFYGQFAAIHYQNYGAGVDYFTEKRPQGFNLSVGIYYSQIIRQDYDGNKGSFTAWVSPRARLTYWINDFGINLTWKGQKRPDLGKDKSVIEFAGGITFKLDR